MAVSTGYEKGAFRKSSSLVRARAAIGVPGDAAKSVRSPIGAIEMRVFNTLLNRVIARPRDRDLHEIDWGDLVASVGMTGNPDRVLQAVDVLSSATIAVDITDGDLEHTLRCHYLSIELTRRDSSRGTLIYGIDPVLARHIHDPKVYSLIQLPVANSLSTPTSIQLYEILKGILYLRDPVWAPTLDEFRRDVDIPQTASRFSNLRQR